jgi:hypothetical protein
MIIQRTPPKPAALVVLLLLAGPAAFAQSVSDSDFFSISSTTIGLLQEHTFTLQIRVATRTPAMAFTLPLTYAGHPNLHIDRSVGADGVTYDSVGNSSRWQSRTVLVDSVNKTILLGFVSFQNPLPPSTGPLATLHFKLTFTDVPAQVTVDSTRIPPANFLSFVDENAEEYIPQFTPGQIDITDRMPIIRFNVSSLTFVAHVDSTNPPPAGFMIINDGAGVLQWRATGDRPWLGLAPESGSGDATVAVSVNTAGLEVGSYTGNITVSDSGAVNSPQVLPVTLKILRRPDPADSNYVSVSTAVAPTNQPSRTSVEITIGTTQPLMVMAIPLTYAGSPYLRVDRTRGERGITWRALGLDPVWNVRVFNVDTVRKTMMVALLPFTQAFAAAEGSLATIHFILDSTAVPDTIPIDTTVIAPNNHLLFYDTSFQTFVPAFQAGAVILEPFRDSLCLSPPVIDMQAIQDEALPPCVRVIGTNCGGISLWTTWIDNRCSGGWLGTHAESQHDSLFLDVCATTTHLDTGVYVCTLIVGAERMVNSPQKLPVVYRVIAPRSEAVVFNCGLAATLLGGPLTDRAAFGTDPEATDGYDAGIDMFKPPPPPGEFVRVFFPHPEWGRIEDQFAADIRSPFLDECKSWWVAVESTRPGPLRLEAECLRPASPLRMRLSDERGHLLAPDFDVYGYTYPSPGGTQLFVLTLCGPGRFTTTYDGGWNLVSSPLEPDDPSLLSVFGPGVDSFQLYGWNGGYFAPTEFHGCGTGYWLLLPVQRTIEYTGAPCGSASNPTRITLHLGWNLIGAPYSIPARLVDAELDSAGLRLPADVAVGRGWFSPSLWSWQGGTYRFGNVLSPGSGYWIPSLCEGIELVLYPFDGAFLASPASPAPEDVVSISVAGTDVSVRVGVHENATDGFDAGYDLPLPPQGPIAPGSWLGIAASMNPLFRYYYQDVRSTAKHAEWSIAVAHAGGATLLFTNTAALTARGYRLTFVDPVDSQNTEIDQDMKVFFDRGRFELVAERVATGVSDRPDRWFLAENYPNPFNPATTIRFGLASPSHVELVIYNVLGGRVRTLDSRDYPAGEHALSWDGRDDRGRAVASGVYFYRLVAGDFDQARKMLLMR